MIAGHFLADDAEPTISAAEAATPAPVAAPRPAADVPAALKGELAMALGTGRAAVPWRDLGVSAEGGKISVDRDRARTTLLGLKARLDRSPVDARLDLDARVVHPHRDGLAIDVYAAIGALESSALEGAGEIELPGTVLPAQVTMDTLGISDISHVLGTFKTTFAVEEKERNANLKLASSKLDGYVLRPGQEFSFNGVVGARTGKEGYKIAHVISDGEMIDGDAGGTCQISTTLHAASFFAGLEIVKARPHTRPSTYIQMGLDATVVYGSTDLVMKNPYDFPVVISYKVGRGEAVVEILGKQRPYDKIEFERHVLKKTPFETVTREDFELPIGTMVIDQFGFPGFKVEKLRNYYRNGEIVKTDRWVVNYAPVIEYVRTGANPDPNLPPPKKPKVHGPEVPSSGTYRKSM
jgi:vancomycin resistance protein YoaR